MDICIDRNQNPCNRFIRQFVGLSERAIGGESDAPVQDTVLCLTLKGNGCS